MSKTIFITGASSGIGQKAALLFQSNGWNVVASMRSPEQDTVLSGLPNVICPVLDVTDDATIDTAVAEAIARFGAIDVVLNNAGYGLIGAFETFDKQQIERQFQTNVFGLMAVTRAVLPHFRQRGSGAFINVTSFAGRSIFPMYSVYHASKWAVEGFCESLQYEVKEYNIRVKIIEPGIVKTAFWGRSTDRDNQSGIGAYERYGQPILELIDNAAGIVGTQPEEVADAIWQATNDNSSRLRYIVGLDAHVTLGLRRLLSDRSYTQVMKGVFSESSQRLFRGIVSRLSSS